MVAGDGLALIHSDGWVDLVSEREQNGFYGCVSAAGMDFIGIRTEFSSDVECLPRDALKKLET